MDSLVRIASISPKIKPAVPEKCLENIIAQIEKMKSSSPDIIVLPRLALSGGSLGHIYRSRTLTDSCMNALEKLREYTSDMRSYVTVGLPINDGGNITDVCAVLFEGELLGYISCEESGAPFEKAYSENILPADTVFAVGDVKFSILPCDVKKLALHTSQIAAAGCDLLIAPSYTPIRAGDVKKAESAIKTVSETLGCAVCVANGGDGDTSSPSVYKSYTGVYECGKRLSFEESNGCTEDAVVSICDIDGDIISASKTAAGYRKPFFKAELKEKSDIIRPVPQNPYIPEDESEKTEFLEELFELQTRSLVSRMAAVGIKKIVIGVSGGLDSTLALLVADAALKELELPPENLLGITMPGFGTSDRTYYNALSLLKELNATSKDIPIRDAVTGHFKDIGHDIAVKDITYENCQARERTQILFDIANSENALVLGTGDLSESALGWCTFNGDHMASYNVNCCLTKTLVRLVTEYTAKNKSTDRVREILLDILDTPVSPELLPADKSGEIAQKTEDILGPYMLHDFFLYYFLKYAMRPTKLYGYACRAFEGELEPEFIKDKLVVFLRRFFSSQFKRSCSPDAADITGVSFANSDFYMPSDCSGKEFVEEASAITL